MRYPDQTGAIIKILKSICMLNPDLRLGQIFAGAFQPGDDIVSLKNIGDNELILRLIKIHIPMKRKKENRVMIYLDDDLVNRKPPSDEWMRLTSYDEFVSWIEAHGLPHAISFDHDLGKGKTGKDCANFLIEYCLDHDLHLPEYSVHSENPVGRENIISLLDNFSKFKNSENE